MAKQTPSPSEVFDKTEADVVVADTDESPKCENHPQRKAITYTNGGVTQSLCDECTPAWYRTTD